MLVWEGRKRAQKIIGAQNGSRYDYGLMSRAS